MTRTGAAEERRRSDSNITNDHGRQANNSNPLRPYMQMGSTNVHTFLSGLRETSHSFQRRFNVPLVARQPSNISMLTVQAVVRVLAAHGLLPRMRKDRNASGEGSAGLVDSYRSPKMKILWPRLSGMDFRGK